MKHLRTVHVTLLLVIAACIPALAQTPDDYSLSLATGWELSAYTDGAKVERVEYIYGDRSAGLLKVKRVRLDSGETLDAYVDRDTAVTLRFLPGFVQGRQERFAGGAMAGMLVQFDFTKGGKPMLGRYYYLAGADNSSIWVLQFTGDRSVLGQARNITDQMARSFRER
ncbi:MAG TPA: hypothetical protein PLF26_04650 [Blastocatellia bacterium]|nr:hypothetical protein [Blastocatellia bacterium]